MTNHLIKNIKPNVCVYFFRNISVKVVVKYERVYEFWELWENRKRTGQICLENLFFQCGDSFEKNVSCRLGAKCKEQIHSIHPRDGGRAMTK